MNFLEQLVAEWYEYSGYYVRRNVLVGKNPKGRGGHECELDVVAFNPKTHHLIHVEPSMDCDSWTVRERRFKKKFDAGKKYIPSIFDGLSITPTRIDQVALLVYAGKNSHSKLGGGRVRLVSDFVGEILKQVKTKPLASNAIPEQFVILRSFQFVEYAHSKDSKASRCERFPLK